MIKLLVMSLVVDSGTGAVDGNANGVHDFMDDNCLFSFDEAQ